MIKIKSLLINIAISLGIGILSGVLTMNSMSNYEIMQKPPLAPSGIIFPIVWSILFILMGISSYRIYESTHPDKKTALTVYAVQLIVNFIWPFIFFTAQQYLAAFIWLVILWVLVLVMIIKFSKIDKAAALLQIPYLLWLTFAGYLNLSVYLLNQ